jgi:ribosome-associated protein
MTVAPVTHSLNIPARVQLAALAALEKKGEDVRIRYLQPVADFTDYFLLASGTNERQVQAIADAIEDVLRSWGVRPLHIEGKYPARWILMDYGDFVVHIFLDTTREFYGLERLWGDAPDVTGELLHSR